MERRGSLTRQLGVRGPHAAGPLLMVTHRTTTGMRYGSDSARDNASEPCVRTATTCVARERSMEHHQVRHGSNCGRAA